MEFGGDGETVRAGLNICSITFNTFKHETHKCMCISVCRVILWNGLYDEIK